MPKRSPAAEMPAVAKEFKFPSSAANVDGAHDDAAPVHITDSTGQSLHLERRPSLKEERRRSNSSRSFGYPYPGHGNPIFSGQATPPAIRG